MADTPTRSSFPTVIAIIGAFAVFIVLLSFKYGTEDSSTEEVVERPSLAEHEAEATALLGGAKVIDAANGKVRLPIDRAMQLVVAENSK
ncbi:hypothetical protein MLD52_13310 [Puniceicoccaceae bacterium K14]|nr:hypothetical protein [Puniceicoccaceae bacterium K14]